MKLEKKDIYGKLIWVSDGSGCIELLVDTEFMSINNPLIRLQIDKVYNEKRAKLEEVMYECLYYVDEDGHKTASEKTLDDLWADYLEDQSYRIQEGEYEDEEEVSLEYANECIEEWESY